MLCFTGSCVFSSVLFITYFPSFPLPFLAVSVPAILVSVFLRRKNILFLSFYSIERFLVFVLSSPLQLAKKTGFPNLDTNYKYRRGHVVFRFLEKCNRLYVLWLCVTPGCDSGAFVLYRRKPRNDTQPMEIPPIFGSYGTIRLLIVERVTNQKDKSVPSLTTHLPYVPNPIDRRFCGSEHNSRW